MSRVNKKALGKQWNRSGSGKSFTDPHRKRMPRIFQKRPKVDDKDWFDSIDDLNAESPEERVIHYVFGDDVDSATEAMESSPAEDSGWLMKLLAEVRSEPKVAPRRVCPETMTLQVASGSDIGCCRTNNEDSVFIDEDLGIFIVCDGMGGHLAGEVASQKAIEYTVDFLAEARSQRIMPEVTSPDFRDVWTDLMVEALHHCCKKVYEFSQSSPELDGMATTITAVMIVDGHAFVGHLGDSRLYLCHGDVVKQLTIDHTLLKDILRENTNYDSYCDPATMNRFKHILTRCVGRGHEEFAPDSFSFPLVENDVLLLCSDGLSNYFESESQLAGLLEGDGSGCPKAVTESLVAFARFGGGSDNISAVVIQVSCGHNADRSAAEDDLPSASLNG